jgi:3-deoxy-7-phosphoheptulonate synthase
MILRFARGTREERVQELARRLESEGLRVLRSPERARPILALVGTLPKALEAELARDPELEALVRPPAALLRVAQAFRDAPTLADVGGVSIGGRAVVVIAGPCSVEGREQVGEVARAVARAGAHVLRGGAYKPRTSPYAFQGLGVEGLRLLVDAGRAVGLPVVSEILDAAELPAFVEHGVDCLQIGARNMQNFSLLKAVARAGKPVLLKRGLAATLEEWLAAAEYLASGGCERIVLCERGIRTFETATRNTLDLTILPLLSEWTHLPVVVDPSHAAGLARLVPPLSRAAIAAGADGIAVEVHPRPEEARSDGPQALLPGELAALVADLGVLAAVGGRHLHAPPRAGEPVATG